jgi:NAD(P)-dependent dehydrogenase (short-subunit alcohol dehydrogenase family)
LPADLTRDGILDSFGLNGRVAIVTGGSRGIGLALAEGFASLGAKVVVASRKAEACEAAAAAIRGRGGDAVAVPAHTGDLDDLQRLVDSTVAHYDGIDIVVNNAANALALPIADITPEAWAKSHDVNLRGPMFLAQAALPHLVASEHAAVLNVVSTGVFLHGGGGALYTSAKAGLLMLTRAMAVEFAPHGIRVNALAPGTVDTDMVRNNTPDAQERMARAAVLRRMASPAEMVGPALLLVSDAGSFITGEVLVADGGLAFH